jgi:hypothetical protein
MGIGERRPGSDKAGLKTVWTQGFQCRKLRYSARPCSALFPGGTASQKYYRAQWPSKRAAVVGLARAVAASVGRAKSCARNRSGSGPECLATPGARRHRAAPGAPVPAHLRHLEAAAVGLQPAFQVELDHLARNQAQAGRVALGAVVSSICMPTQTPNSGLRRRPPAPIRAGPSRAARACSRAWRPGRAARAGRRALLGREVTTTVQPVPCAAACTACDTERRLPMP